MGGEHGEVETIVEQLRQQRDELRLKLHLAKAEVRDVWDDLERKWEHLRARLPLMREAVSESSKDVAAAARLLAEEIRHGYERLRKTL